MAVAFDAKTALWKNVSGVATMTVANLTVGSGSNRALLVHIFWSIGTTPTGITVTWDSGGTNQACTQISGTVANNSVLPSTTACYGLINPIAGNRSLVISWTGNQEAHACAISFTGVDQTSVAVAFPHGNTNTSNSSASPCTVTITSATGNMVSAMHAENFSAIGAISGTTLAKDDATGPNLAVASNYDNGAATVTLTAAYTGTGPRASAGCDILASAASVFTYFEMSSSGLLLPLGRRMPEMVGY